MVANRRIPTILALGLVAALVLGVAFSVSGLERVTKFLNFASSGAIPARVTVANVTDTSFTVAWTTEKEEGGAVAFGKTANLGDGVAVDERNIANPSGKYRAHLVRISGLAAEAKYYYKIQPGGGTPGEVMTGPKLSPTQMGVVDPIYGLVTGGSGALVVWGAAGAGKLAVMAKDDGNYVIPLGSARTVDLANYFSLPSGVVETVMVDSGDGLATISCVAGKDRPLPTVTIGQTVDCRTRTTLSSVPTASMTSSSSSGGFKVPKKTPMSTGGGTQVNLSNGETVSTPLPTITGQVGPGQVVKIQIRSETPYSGTVVADPAGNWTWTPPANLSPGPHTVTVTIVNADGTTQTVTRQFSVMAGSPILPITSGTPSATLTHKTCVSSSCVVVSGLGSDSCTGDSDCTAISPPAQPPPEITPPTGAVENTLLLVGAGVLFLIVGTRLWRII